MQVYLKERTGYLRLLSSCIFFFLHTSLSEQHGHTSKHVYHYHHIYIHQDKLGLITAAEDCHRFKRIRNSR